MIAEAISALGALKSASDTAKSLVELRDIALVREKAIELQTQILTAQQIALDARAREESLISKVGNLEREIAELKDWNAEKVAYELTPIGTGAFAYARKPDASPPQPPHWLCAKCFTDHRKSILQYAGRTNNRNDSIYQCQCCGGKVQTHWSMTPEKTAEAGTTPIPCPYCSSKTRLQLETDHPQLGAVGVKDHTLQCVSCQKTVTRMFTAKAGYKE